MRLIVCVFFAKEPAPERSRRACRFNETSAERQNSPDSQSGLSHKPGTEHRSPVPIIALRVPTGNTLQTLSAAEEFYRRDQGLEDSDEKQFGTQSQIGRMLQAGQMSSTLISLRRCGGFTPTTTHVTVSLPT